MLITSILVEDVEILEGIFATLTPNGWVIPEWLIYLRSEVIKRDELTVDQKTV